MSKSDDKVSGEAEDEQKNDSVFDYLYCDTPRIGSFLAQFDNAGHLKEITESESASKGTSRGLKFGVGASYLGTGGNLNFDRSPGEHGAEATQRVYDPLWLNARAFMDYLETANLICRDITNARLGQFVIASGSLSVLDTTLLTPLWKSNILKRGIDKWAKSPEGMKNKDYKETAGMAMEIVPFFPHFPQCKIKGSNFVVWSTLAPEGMAGTVSDLSLKHGTEIPGEWSILGVLDAFPSPIPTPMAFPESGTAKPFESLIKNFSNLARTTLGRSEDAYGMTALLLFRKISTGAN